MSASEPPSFFSKLDARVSEIESLLCVGLDPHITELFPKGDGESKSEEERCDAAYSFCKTLIDETAEHAAAFKPNAAFFEALGPNLGNATLRRVVAAIPSSIPTLLDVKRGDIGSTAQAYAEACYDDKNGINADGVTLSPLMGWDSVAPFITGKYSKKGAFLLCKTSNPGSNDLLAMEINHNTTVFEKIASLTQMWSDKAAEESTNTEQEVEPPRLGLVVGATDLSALTKVRKLIGPGTWILAPGVGAQGADLDSACRCGMNSKGSGMLIPVSRGISRAQNPGEKAKELKENINEARKAVSEGSINEEASHVSSAEEVTTYQKDFMEFSLEQGVLKFGSFVLKSGRTSPYFFNAGLFSSGAALYKLGKAYAATIMSSKELTDANGNVTFDLIFGPAYKGISLAAIVCAELFSAYGVNVGFAYDRKEAKDHGEGGKLVGMSMVNKRVLIVDDVITAGTAVRQSHEMLKSIDAISMGIVIALDRAEKRSLDDPISAVQAVSRDLDIPVVSIISLPQLEIFLRNSSEFEKDLIAKMLEYRSQYGV